MGTNLWPTGVYLDAEVSSVNIISQEEISCCGRVTADLEEFHQIILAMDQFRMDSRVGTGRGKGLTY